MTRRWVGPTPWTHVLAHYAEDKRVIPYSQVETQGQDKGYREAMNSPVVVNAINALRDLLSYVDKGWTPETIREYARRAVAAYEAGQQEEEHGETQRTCHD